MDFSIFSLFLPEGLLSHFDIVDFKELADLKTKKDCFYIYLDQKTFFLKIMTLMNLSQKDSMNEH